MDEKREKVDDASVAGNGAMTAYVIFFILGIGNLLPWNAFITAAGYFHQRFCNTPHKV
jgi:hypothetical protein